MNKLITLIFFGLLYSTSLFALSQKQQEFLKRHDYLTEREMISKAPWPKVTIYMKINATPEEAMALFSDFERQKDYVPNLLKSKVARQVSPVEVHTEYKLKMPWPLSDSSYIHGTIISKKEKDYFIKWFVVESETTDKIDGSATFSHFEGKTLMTYKSLIYPKSFLAPLFAGTMVDDTEASALAIKKFIEAEVAQKGESYEHSLSLLRRSLAGEMVFVKKK